MSTSTARSRVSCRGASKWIPFSCFPPALTERITQPGFPRLTRLQREGGGEREQSTGVYVVYVGRKGTGPCDRRYVSIRTDGASVTSARVRSSRIEELTLWMNEWPKCCYVCSSRVWHTEPCVQERTNLFLGDCVLRVVKSPLSFCFVPSPTTPFQTHTSQAVLLPHIFETVAHLGSIGFCWNYASIDWFNLTGLNFTFSLLRVLVLCPLLSLCGLVDSQCINCK